jgi:hypothetical protein
MCCILENNLSYCRYSRSDCLKALLVEGGFLFRSWKYLPVILECYVVSSTNPQDYIYSCPCVGHEGVWRGGSMVPLIFKFSCYKEVNCQPAPAALLRWKDPRNLLNTTLVEPQIEVSTLWKLIKSFALLAVDPRIVNCPACSLVTIPTEQSQLLNKPGMATGCCVLVARPQNFEIEWRDSIPYKCQDTINIISRKTFCYVQI